MELFQPIVVLAVLVALVIVGGVLLSGSRAIAKLLRVASGVVQIVITVTVVLAILVLLGVFSLSSLTPPATGAASKAATPTNRPVPTITRAGTSHTGVAVSAKDASAANELRDYFQMVSEHNLSGGLMRLSQNFLDAHFPRNQDGSYDFSSYLNWWNKVSRVEVGTVEVEQERNQEAIVTAELKYHLANGAVKTEKHWFRLVWQEGWLIDEEKTL